MKKKRERAAALKKGEAYKDVDLDALNDFCDDFMAPSTDQEACQ